MKKNQHILLVEDNPDDVELTLLAFQKNNLANRIDVVNDGAAALDYIFAAGKFADRDVEELPAVILLDINLPKLNGLEVLKELRGNRITKNVPIVMLTSSGQHEDLLTSYDRGANSFIRKPVDFSKFVEAVKTLEVYWLLLNDTPY